MKHREYQRGVGTDGKLHLFEPVRGFSLCAEQQSLSPYPPPLADAATPCWRCLAENTNQLPPVQR